VAVREMGLILENETSRSVSFVLQVECQVHDIHWFPFSPPHQDELSDLLHMMVEGMELRDGQQTQRWVLYRYIGCL